MNIITYKDKYKEQIIELILSIQNDEANINLSINEQPDLLNIKDYYQKCNGEFWIALDDNDCVIGTIGLMNKENSYGILKKLFVRKDFRGEKVGYELYQRLLKFCKNHEIHHIILDTPSVAKVSHKFYERAGFTKIQKELLPIKYEYPDRNSYLYLINLNK